MRWRDSVYAATPLLEQLRVDNSGTGPNWEQLAKGRPLV